MAPVGLRSPTERPIGVVRAGNCSLPYEPGEEKDGARRKKIVGAFPRPALPSRPAAARPPGTPLDLDVQRLQNRNSEHDRGDEERQENPDRASRDRKSVV